jgi:hypothetical protein
MITNLSRDRKAIKPKKAISFVNFTVEIAGFNPKKNSNHYFFM